MLKSRRITALCLSAANDRNAGDRTQRGEGSDAAEINAIVAERARAPPPGTRPRVRPAARPSYALGVAIRITRTDTAGSRSDERRLRFALSAADARRCAEIFRSSIEDGGRRL